MRSTLPRSRLRRSCPRHLPSLSIPPSLLPLLILLTLQLSSLASASTTATTTATRTMLRRAFVASATATSRPTTKTVAGRTSSSTRGSTAAAAILFGSDPPPAAMAIGIVGPRAAAAAAAPRRGRDESPPFCHRRARFALAAAREDDRPNSRHFQRQSSPFPPSFLFPDRRFGTTAMTGGGGCLRGYAAAVDSRRLRGVSRGLSCAASVRPASEGAPATPPTTDASTSPSDSSSLPSTEGWWPEAHSGNGGGVAFGDHVVHVIVSDDSLAELAAGTRRVGGYEGEGENGGAHPIATVEWVVQSAIDLARRRERDDDDGDDNDGGLLIQKIGGRGGGYVRDDDDAEEERRRRRSRIVDIEWAGCEGAAVGERSERGGRASASAAGTNRSKPGRPSSLDPGLRHDPSLLPQPPRSMPSLSPPPYIAAELLALGAVYRLPTVYRPSGSDDAKKSDSRPILSLNPSSGAKPRRLSVGERDEAVRNGDYFRVHRDPRRFPATNAYDWGARVAGGEKKAGDTLPDGGADGAVENDGAGPGVVAARDDTLGYWIVDKPPGVPVHRTVDNALENVASSVGRVLWAEMRGREAGKDSRARPRGSGVDPEREGGRSEGTGVCIGVGGVENDGVETIADLQKRRGMGGEKKQRRKGRGKNKPETLVYVATPQRLDQNTSGLLVVATKRSFAAYFSKLLRMKTDGQLMLQASEEEGEGSGINVSGGEREKGQRKPLSCGVHKTYRCLVCISPDGGTAMSNDDHGLGHPRRSVRSEVERLRKCASEGAVVRHFLEPSVRAPKNFVSVAPRNSGEDDVASPWAECLLRIKGVGDVCTVVGNGPSESLAESLWGGGGKPDGCVAVVELDVELLTGRTHQIRGQLSAMGFSLVGDAQYGGSVVAAPAEEKLPSSSSPASYLDSERLALQCCSLEFLKPVETRGRETDGEADDGTITTEEEVVLRRSEKWELFQLDRAFWTTFLETYETENSLLFTSEATTGSADDWSLESSQSAEVQENDTGKARPLPPRVLLSPGANKYVILRATEVPEKGGLMAQESDEKSLWFVRSASPAQCGGPYHMDVAKKVLRQLRTVGYQAEVMGGGRIDYCVGEEILHAHVYGFSYGFGKGDHEKVASIIEEHGMDGVVATFDASDGLY